MDDAIKSVLEYYKDKDEYLQKNTPKIISAIEGYKFILSNIEIYKKLAKLEYQNYKEYVNSININDNKIAISDIFLNLESFIIYKEVTKWINILYDISNKVDKKY